LEKGSLQICWKHITSEQVRKEKESACPGQCVKEMQRTGKERRAAEREDQNGNEKGVERIGHVKEHYMP
jgi:hypothetical protein